MRVGPSWCLQSCKTLQDHLTWPSTPELFPTGCAWLSLMAKHQTWKETRQNGKQQCHVAPTLLSVTSSFCYCASCAFFLFIYFFCKRLLLTCLPFGGYTCLCNNGSVTFFLKMVMTHKSKKTRENDNNKINRTCKKWPTHTEQTDNNTLNTEMCLFSLEECAQQSYHTNHNRSLWFELIKLAQFHLIIIHRRSKWLLYQQHIDANG